MELFLRATALVLLGVILILVLQRSREMGLLVSLGICVSVILAAVSMLEPVLEFLKELRRLGGLDREFLNILLKCAGIGMIGEVAALICADAGETAMAKAVQLLTNGAMLLLSLPLLRQMVRLLEEVLGMG